MIEVVAFLWNLLMIQPIKEDVEDFWFDILERNSFFCMFLAFSVHRTEVASVVTEQGVVSGIKLLLWADRNGDDATACSSSFHS